MLCHVVDPSVSFNKNSTPPPRLSKAASSIHGRDITRQRQSVTQRDAHPRAASRPKGEGRSEEPGFTSTSLQAISLQPFTQHTLPSIKAGVHSHHHANRMLQCCFSEPLLVSVLSHQSRGEGEVVFNLEIVFGLINHAAW